LGLRKIAWIDRSTIVFACERGTGHEAGSTVRLLQECEATTGTPYVAIRVKGTEFGWITNNTEKLCYAREIRDAMDAQRLQFMAGWCAAQDFSEYASRDADTLRSDVRAEFCKELSNVRQVPLMGNNAAATLRITVNGKVDQRGNLCPGQNDDMYVSTAMAIYLSTLLMQGKMPNFPYRGFRLS
jgi:hypothetical protein